MTLVLALVWVKLISRWLIAASIAPNCALPATPRKKKKKKKPSTKGGGHAEKSLISEKKTKSIEWVELPPPTLHGNSP